jgi:hypothetical protein
MFPVLVQADPSGVGCPFHCPHYLQSGGRIAYPRDACPVAADFYNRNVMVWLDPDYDETDCAAIAAGTIPPVIINREFRSALCCYDLLARGRYCASVRT